MKTNDGTICVLAPSNKVYQVYLHRSTDKTKAILDKHYSTTQKALDLIDNGAIHRLRKTIIGENSTVFYRRDLGVFGDNTGIKIYEDIDKFLTFGKFVGTTYFFDSMWSSYDLETIQAI